MDGLQKFGFRIFPVQCSHIGLSCTVRSVGRFAELPLGRHIDLRFGLLSVFDNCTSPEYLCFLLMTGFEVLADLSVSLRFV